MSRMKIVATVVLLIYVSCLSSCLRALTESGVVGSYKAEIGDATSTLILRPDHSFEQTVQFPKMATRKASGTWQLKLKSPGSSLGRLIMTECLRFDHEMTSEKWAGGDFSVTALGFTDVEISLDPDRGVAYRK